MLLFEMTFRKSQYLAETFTTKKRNEKSEKDSDSNDGLTRLKMYHLKTTFSSIYVLSIILGVIVHPRSHMDIYLFKYSSGLIQYMQ